MLYLLCFQYTADQWKHNLPRQQPKGSLEPQSNIGSSSIKKYHSQTEQLDLYGADGWEHKESKNNEN